MFEINIDIPAGLVRFKLAGSWDVDEMQRFERAIKAEMDKFHALGRSFNILADLTDFPTQNQLVAERHRPLVSDGKRRGLHKSANIVSTTLSKLQFKRLAASEDFQFFMSEELALSWLAEHETEGL